MPKKISFKKLLHKAIKPEQSIVEKPDNQDDGGYSEKKTRSRKAASTSAKPRDTFR